MEADSTTIESDNTENKIVPDVNKESTLFDEISRNEGFFNLVMRPILKSGHEKELLEWMKESNLIPSAVKCSKENSGCSMQWASCRVVDKYQWQCNNCNQKVPIRENSFFKNVYCTLSAAFKVILAWCEDVEINNISSVLGIKKQIISTIYDKIERVVCGRPLPQLGGPGNVLLVELYPDIVRELYPDSSKSDDSNKSHVRILCLADTRKIPTQYWLHVITGYTNVPTENNNTKIKKLPLNEEVLHVLEKMCLPGGYCALGGGEHLSSSLETLQGTSLFQTVTTINQLTSQCNKDMQTFLTKGIWKHAITLCEAAQDLQKNKMQTYLSCSVWRHQQEREDPFQAMVHLIAAQDHTYTPSKSNRTRHH